MRTHTFYQNSLAGIRARQLCSDTCGCSNPRSSLALSLPMSGCGSTCARSGKHAQVLQNISCVDVSTDDPIYQAFIAEALVAADSWPADWRMGSKNILSDLQRHGCSFIRNGAEMFAYGNGTVSYPPFLYGINLCSHATYFPFKALGYFCPVACSCRAGDPYCPFTCPVRSDKEKREVCPEYMRSKKARPLTATLGVCPMLQK